MSAPSTRRHKDPNAGARQKFPSGQNPSKPLTPVSTSSKNPHLSHQKSSSGKENPVTGFYRALGSTQKPMIRPVPRVEKAVLGGGSDNRAGVRRSASSGPRGRSQSPSEFIRIFSDLRKEKGSRVSADREELGLGKNTSGSMYPGAKRAEIDNKISGISSKSSSVSEETEKKTENKTNLCSDPVKVRNFTGSGSYSRSEVNLKLDSCEEKSGTAAKSENKIEKIGKGITLGSKRASLDGNVKIPETSKDDGVREGSFQATNKHPTKLHEKLAFLEGKVKRIASDIKKTKEMLDMNNPDASKVILSDIQEKISGIEKAMSHVVTGSGDKTGLKTSKETEYKQLANVKCSAKGLNSEELEDRLFPHRKLLRSRTQSNISSEGVKSHASSNSAEPGEEIKVEEKALSPIEENPIALEFLASLEKEKSKVTIRRREADLKNSEVQEMDTEETSRKHESSKLSKAKSDFEDILAADETLDEFDDEGTLQEIEIEEIEDACSYHINEIGTRASTGGWFVSEGEAVLLAHDDGSCSYYDVANGEVKSVYNPPSGISPNIWRDCWIIRAPGSDGCSGRYVVAASAGNTLDSGFCSWDFYTKDIKSFHFEKESINSNSRTVLAPISNNTMYSRNTLANSSALEAQQWWYKPCGPLIISTASSQRTLRLFDIRDGEQVMRWEVQRPVSVLDYSSPLQWRNRGKVVIAESETVSVWDVNSLHPEALSSVSSSGRKILAIHINNTDAELGGGVRQRATSSEAEGNDGVFCTTDSINILDFRHPSGIGSKIPKLGVNAQSVFSRGDSIFLGCTNSRSSVKTQLACQVQQFSLRKQRLVSTYALPESNSHLHHAAITQVWGNSNLVMAVSGLGLSVFDATKEESLNTLTGDYLSPQNVRETIGPDDMYAPTFDYLGSRALLISRDRPALWRYLL